MTEAAMTQSLRVLVVDDDRFSLAILSAMLEQMGHEPVLAASGEEALDLFRARQPDAVLMDVRMTGMDGYETVRAMRQIADSWIPIIFITGMERPEDMLLGLNAGGDDYLFKPLNYDVLRIKIGALQQHLQRVRLLVKNSQTLLDYQARNEEELVTALEVMRRLSRSDQIDDPQVHFYLQAAESFSGDMIAVARTPAGQLFVMLADSTGHGLTAAIAGIPVLKTFRTMVPKGFSLGAIVTEINSEMKAYLPPNRYVAATLLALDTENCMISVWNGGGPPAVVIAPDGLAVHQFDSRHVPLGILKPNEFDAGVARFYYGPGPCQILLCSDGAVEGGAQGADMRQGMSRLLRAAHTADRAARLPRMVETIQQQLAGKVSDDDIALLLVDCLIAPDRGQSAEDRAQRTESREQGTEQVEWQFGLTLTAPQLKQLDIVPLLRYVLVKIERDGTWVAPDLFLVLSELFNNALDHGLLKLDSALKHDLEGMERYYEERAACLKQLEHGEIRIMLEKVSGANGSRIKITFSDSGDGFDHHGWLSAMPDADTQRHGRGIMLVQNMCYSLEYQGNGSEVVVYYNLAQA